MIKDSPARFGTKAETLARLSTLVTTCTIGDLFSFTVNEWQDQRPHILKSAKSKFPKSKLIVRSSALLEDTLTTSGAGQFRSVADISSQNEVELESAIEEVIASYKDPDTRHQVFLQKFLSPVELSGVVFTRDIDTGAPYMTFNIDETSGKTDTITGGTGLGHTTLVVYRNFQGQFKDKRVERIYFSIRELEELLGNTALDIEFCFVEDTVYILQVRPLVNVNKSAFLHEDKVATALKHIEAKIRELNLKHPHLYGKKSAYGIMPDWNPAEMIGIKPRPLALSLYKELITDNIWAYQRDNYGYKNLRSFPLMVSFAGHPYIDVRVDFNSFLPKKLSDPLSNKLADFYMEKLHRIPTSHDKVEFDIVYSCYTFDLESRLGELLEHGFSKDEIIEIKESLLQLTNTILDLNGLFKIDIDKIHLLEKKRTEILATDLSEISKIYWLIEDCKRYGTLPFAGLARAAFVAVQFLNSMVELDIIREDQKDDFMRSLDTVTKDLSLALEKLSHGKMTMPDFLKEFGHLRPGTYDILSESYEENPTKYFDLENIRKSTTHTRVPFHLDVSQTKRLTALIKDHRLNVSTDEFLLFLKKAIEAREYAKFVFTKSLNEILKHVAQYGKNLGFTRDDMSYLDIGSLLHLYSTIASVDERALLYYEIERNRHINTVYKTIKLPHIILEPEDIYHFYQDAISPNYVTHATVLGEPVVIRNSDATVGNLDGKIVFIESADPGFDWIFSHRISGLVTMYGGVNSHMAIRSSELGIAAIIGCGPVNFASWQKARRLEIDCLNKRVNHYS